MSSENFELSNRLVVDQYGNQLEIVGEIARGGQGVVFKSSDPDIAIKQPLLANGRIDKSKKLQDLFERIRWLPLPEEPMISLPVSLLAGGEPGYLMPLLNDMKPFSSFEINGEDREALKSAQLPEWLQQCASREAAELLLHYASTGSAKRRLLALYKCASILARIHAAGLVYGDVSPNNAFIGEGDSAEVWLIDADNLRFERRAGGASVYSPSYGAPEVVRALDSSRPYSDIWAFAVMAFKLLSLSHPFIGQAVLEPDSDDGGWDSDDWNDCNNDSKPADLDEQAYAGYLPFVDDETDDSNRAVSGLSRELFLTPELKWLFEETLGVGRTKPWRRASLSLWAKELARAHDMMLTCPACNMTYFHTETQCPFCGSAKPDYVVASTSRWHMIIQGSTRDFEVALPNRLVEGFSLKDADAKDYDAIVHMDTQRVEAVRGTTSLPDGLAFRFEGGARNAV